MTAETKKKNRDDILRAFRKRKIKAIVNVGIVTHGFDYPELDTIILSRPTMSMGLYYQQIGRGIRPHENKENCIVIDLTDNHKRFGKIEDMVLKYNNNLPYICNNDRQLTNVYYDEFTNGEIMDMPMPFGKHKGKMVSEVDIYYLKWLDKEGNLNEPLMSTVKQQYRLKMRENKSWMT